MTKEALFVEDRCKIPVWDEQAKLWYVRYRVNHQWQSTSFANLKEASNFYNDKYLQIRSEYRKTHQDSLKLHVDLTLLTKGEILR